MLAPEGGTPSSENLLLDPAQEFSGQNGVNCSLTGARQGLSNAAQPNNLLEYQVKLALNTTSNETLFRVFSGAHLTAQLRRIWGAIKQKEPIFLGLQSQNGGDLHE